MFRLFDYSDIMIGEKGKITIDTDGKSQSMQAIRISSFINCTLRVILL